MIVYIEYLIIDNMVINYVILYLTSLILCTKISIVRLLIGAGVGTLFAFILPLVNMNTFVTLIIKLLIGALICVCSNKSMKFNLFILYYSIFIMITFVIGGFCFAILFLLSGDILVTSYNLEFPIGVLILLIFLYSLYIKKLVFILKKRSKITDFIYDIKLMEKSKEVEILAFFDSGNGLYDLILNKPIIVINLQTLLRLVDNEQLNYLLIGNYEKSGLKNIHKIEYKTISSNSRLIVFSIDNILLKNKNKLTQLDAMIGVSLNNIVKFESYDALIGPKVLEV